eukprot:5384162-Alexandrium_andersonii.AAC.1
MVAAHLRTVPACTTLAPTHSSPRVWGQGSAETGGEHCASEHRAGRRCDHRVEKERGIVRGGGLAIVWGGVDH